MRNSGILIGKMTVLSGLALAIGGGPWAAGLTDKTQTGAGIAKSLEQQVGMGQGDINTVGSSYYIIKRDPFRAIVRGRQLFQRKFTHAQGLGPRKDDGIGDIATTGALGAGLGDSCAACHAQPRGSAGFGGSVFTRPDHRDTPHLFGLGLVEMLADEITADLRAIREATVQRAQARNRHQTSRLVSKGITYGKITAFPDGSVNTSRVKGVNPDLRVRPFFAEGTTISMREFLVGAFDAEMGVQSPDPLLAAAAAGSDVTTPSGMVLSGSLDSIEAPPVTDEFDDGDGDGVVNELPVALVDFEEFYLLNYFRPGTYWQTAVTRFGKALLYRHRCTSCHVPDLTIDRDRRVGDVETGYDPQQGVFNNLFAVVGGLFEEIVDDPGLPSLKLPLGGSFVVEGIYADFRRHDLGPNFWERNFDGTVQKAFMTKPLWGVGTTPPYGHDGRSINLHEVIMRHGGEAQGSRDRYARSSAREQDALRAFLESLVLFPPPDTASNTDPGDPDSPNYPQEAHGSIDLSVLFNDPTDAE